MNKKEKFAFAVVAALTMASGGFAMGQSVNNVSSEQVIYACVTGVNGNITKVSNTPKTCPKGTTPISWNMVGPKGDPGVQGLKGDQGVPGPRGESAQGIGQDFFLVDPQGNKYQIMRSYYGDYLNVNGKLWTFNGEAVAAVDGPASDVEMKLALFTGDNCETNPYFEYLNQYAPIPGKVYALNKIWGDYSSGYTIQKENEFNLSKVKSVYIASLGNCVQFDGNYYTDAVNTWVNTVMLNKVKIRDAFLGLQSNWHDFNFGECDLKIYWYKDYSDWWYGYASSKTVQLDYCNPLPYDDSANQVLNLLNLGWLIPTYANGNKLPLVGDIILNLDGWKVTIDSKTPPAYYSRLYAGQRPEINWNSGWTIELK